MNSIKKFTVSIAAAAAIAASGLGFAGVASADPVSSGQNDSSNAALYQPGQHVALGHGQTPREFQGWQPRR